MKFTEEPTQSSGGGKSMFLKIADGESVYCVLRGDIKVSYSRWTGTTYEPAKKGEQGASMRFKVNAIVAEDKKPVAKILEGGGHLYFDLKNINEEFPLETTMIKITRTGVKQNTRFTVSVAGPKAQPDEKTMKAIEAVKLHPLESTKGQTDVGNDLPSFDDNDEIPF
jgi:hypothetical protein